MGRDKAEQDDNKRRWYPKQAGGGTADWTGVDANVIRDAIAAVSYRGGALRFGYTRDGGAYALGVYGDGKPYTIFIPPREDVEDYLRDLVTVFEDYPVPDRANGNGNKR